MTEVRKAIRAALRMIARPYRVRINWDGETFTHRAATVADALDWAANYPEGSEAWITTRSGALITSRRTTPAKRWTFTDTYRPRKYRVIPPADVARFFADIVDNTNRAARHD